LFEIEVCAATRRLPNRWSKWEAMLVKSKGLKCVLHIRCYHGVYEGVLERGMMREYSNRGNAKST
jgi:hypothetical protein